MDGRGGASQTQQNWKPWLTSADTMQLLTSGHGGLQEPSMGILRPFSEPAPPPRVFTSEQLKRMATRGASFLPACQTTLGY